MRWWKNNGKNFCIAPSKRPSIWYDSILRLPMSKTMSSGLKRSWLWPSNGPSIRKICWNSRYAKKCRSNLVNDLTKISIPKSKVTELYIRGWDDFAETKLEQLAQPSSMGKKLLRITGARLNQYIKDKPEIYTRVVSIGSLISLYLETLVSNFTGHVSWYIDLW